MGYNKTTNSTRQRIEIYVVKNFFHPYRKKSCFRCSNSYFSRLKCYFKGFGKNHSQISYHSLPTFITEKVLVFTVAILKYFVDDITHLMYKTQIQVCRRNHKSEPEICVGEGKVNRIMYRA